MALVQEPYLVLPLCCGTPVRRCSAPHEGAATGKRERKFDVFITSDRNLSFQQSIETSKIHVILLKAPTNIYEDLLPVVDKLKPLIREHKPGQFDEVE